MRVNNQRRTPTGFTLVELLVVIVIIAILMALLLVALRAVQGRATDAVLTTELVKLDAAVNKFRDEFGFYPPDFRELLDSNGNPLPWGPNVQQRLLEYVNQLSPTHQEMQPDPSDNLNRPRLQAWWEIVGMPLAQYGHETALWYWLSQTFRDAQFPLTARRLDGAIAPGVERRVFFEFQATRLHELADGIQHPILFPHGQIFHYEQAGTGNAPYVYFHHRSYGFLLAEHDSNMYPQLAEDHQLGEVAAYAIFNQAANQWEFFNPRSFQIIAAGSDANFGIADDFNGARYADVTNIAGNYVAHADNQTNFSEGRLETMEINQP